MTPESRLPSQADEAAGNAGALERGVPPRPPVDSTELLQGCRSVEIHHNGEVYRLQETRLGKLILTK